MILRVALVGKPNVGKSTIFNRFLGKRKAIVSNVKNTTRDRLYGTCNWINKKFIIIDTGGLTISKFSFQQNINSQVEYAINEADVILFTVSLKDGLDDNDKYVGKIIKKNKGKNVLLVCNKSENNNYEKEKDLINLGFGKPYYISAEHGQGFSKLCDDIIKFDKTTNTEQEEKKHTCFCIIGKTNVGKSSLVNCILNKQRVVVSETEHTTRDAINEDFIYNNKQYTIIDTAGIRRKGHITDEIEKYAVLRTQMAIESSNMILLVLDSTKPFSEQDEVIAGLAYKANIPTIIVINKWDAVEEKNEYSMNSFIKLVRAKFQFIEWAPIVFVSALKNKRIQTIFETIELIQKQMQIKVNIPMLNNIIQRAQLANPSPKVKGVRLQISFATQVKSQVPTFVMFVNKPEALHFTYARYIENTIRSSFGIDKVPITVYYKDKNKQAISDVLIKKTS